MPQHTGAEVAFTVNQQSRAVFTQQNHVGQFTGKLELCRRLDAIFRPNPRRKLLEQLRFRRDKAEVAAGGEIR